MTEQLRKARRLALLVLYAIDIADVGVDEALENAIEPGDGPPLSEIDGDDHSAYWDEVVRRVRGVWERREEIDDEIRSLSPNWRIERMAAVDRNLLRLGIFEILEEITPPLIAINACVELAKEFGTASTPGFINGLLDQLCQDHDIPIERSQ